MKLEQTHINQLITEYIEDSYSFGDENPDLINETLNSYKQLILDLFHILFDLHSEAF